YRSPSRNTTLMSSVHVVEKPPKIMDASQKSISTTSSGKAAVVFLLGVGASPGKLLHMAHYGMPVTLKNGEVLFHSNSMSEGEYYPFTFKNKQYLIKRVGSNIDLYEIQS